DGLLRFAGKVGSGFTAKTRRELLDRLEPLATDQPPFDPPPERKGELRRVVWVRPETVIRAELGGWTRDGVVRQAAFKGIDPGHDPRKVVRERAVESSAAMAEAESRSSAPEPAPERPALRRKASGGRSDGASPARSDPPSAAPAKPASRTPKPASRKSKPAVAKGGRAVPPDGAAWSATEDELAALDGLGKEGVWSVGGHDLKLTNLDKVLFPPKSGSTDGPVTKRELIRYFALIAPTMLPHLGDRPLNLHRYPNGAGAPGFWQKNIPETAPKFLRIWHEVGFEEREDREANDHVVADQVATLCWLANQAAFEIHAWTSTIDDPWRPTFAYVDIDPGEKTTWAETLQIARLYRTAFEHLGVRAYPKVTGRRGLQAWIPIVPHRYTYADTSGWVEKVSRAVGAMVPDLVSWEWSKSERQGRARLDYTQNAPIKTLVAPYAVRPAPGAPVSAPITWDELDDPELRPDRWTIRDEPARVERVGDLFVAAQTEAQELPAV
ncbi:MAG: hypothetical protein ACJ761_00115, partial [Chloroflexota bacterium]